MTTRTVETLNINTVRDFGNPELNNSEQVPSSWQPSGRLVSNEVKADEAIPAFKTTQSLPANPNYRMLVFSDGTSMYIKKEWVDISPLLANENIIFESPELFKKYMIPILKREPIPSVDCDELHEIDTIIQLCKNYGITLDDAQIINISDSFGLNLCINELKSILSEVTSFWHRDKKKRFEEFKIYWDEHVKLKARQYNNPLFESLTCDQIVSTLTNSKNLEMYLEISKMNIKFNNILYRFGEYLKKAIYEKSFKEISDINMKMSLTLNGGIVEGMKDVLGFVQNIVGMIPDKYKEKVGGIILEKVKNVSAISELIQ